MSAMKAAVVEGFGQELVVGDNAIPEPGPGQAWSNSSPPVSATPTSMPRTVTGRSAEGAADSRT